MTESPSQSAPDPNLPYRQGNLVLVGSSTIFPNICVKTGEPATEILRSRFAWPDQVMVWCVVLGLGCLTAFFDLAAGVVVGGMMLALTSALSFHMGRVIPIPLSADALRAHRRTVLMALAAFAIFFASIPAMYVWPSAHLGIAAFVYFFVLACVFNAYYPPLKMSRMDSQFMYLKGASPKFLEALPELSVARPYYTKGPSDPRQCVWRQGRMLIARKGAILPGRCLKTNQPTTQFIHMRVQPLSPLVWVLLLFSMACIGLCAPIAMLVVLLLRPRLDLKFPFCEEVMAERRRNILITLSVLALLCSIVPVFEYVTQGGGFLGAILFILACCILKAIMTPPMVQIDSIVGDLIYIKDVNRDFLAELPEY